MPMSVAENIAYGHPNAGLDEIIEAAKAAQADQFIRRLPNGYDTVIGERGLRLLAKGRALNPRHPGWFHMAPCFDRLRRESHATYETARRLAGERRVFPAE